MPIFLQLVALQKKKKSRDFLKGSRALLLANLLRLLFPSLILLSAVLLLRFKVLRVLRLELKLRYGVLVAGLPRAK